MRGHTSPQTLTRHRRPQTASKTATDGHRRSHRPVTPPAPQRLDSDYDASIRTLLRDRFCAFSNARVVTRDSDELSIRRGRVAFTRRLRSRDETRHRLTGRPPSRIQGPQCPREDSLMITVILRNNHLVAWRMYAIENAPHVAKMSTSRASKPTHAPSEPMMSPFMP